MINRIKKNNETLVYESPLNKTIEQITCLDVLNLTEKEAIELIKQRELIYHIQNIDGKNFPHTDPCYISDRINLDVRKNRVIGTEIG